MRCGLMVAVVATLALSCGQSGEPNSGPGWLCPQQLTAELLQTGGTSAVRDAITRTLAAEQTPLGVTAEELARFDPNLLIIEVGWSSDQIVEGAVLACGDRVELEADVTIRQEGLPEPLELVVGLRFSADARAGSPVMVELIPLSP